MNHFDFNIGTQVHCQDGNCGRLAKVVVNPDTQQVTDLIVEAGFLLKRARVFPITIVETTTADGIYFSIKSEDLGNYPEYREVEYERPASGAEGATFTASGAMLQGGMVLPEQSVSLVREKVREGLSSEDLRLVAQGTPLKNQEGVFGKVDHVIVDADSTEITGLIVRHGFVFPELLNLPVSLIEHVGENYIFVAATNEELKQLPRYTPVEEKESMLE